MEGIDLKDRKILYELDDNSRRSATKIGRKIGLHKNVANYRIKRLEELGIIKGYYTVINSYKIGYDMFRFYIVYRQVTPDIRYEIINHFINIQLTVIKWLADLLWSPG